MTRGWVYITKDLNIEMSIQRGRNSPRGVSAKFNQPICNTSFTYRVSRFWKVRVLTYLKVV